MRLVLLGCLSTVLACGQAAFEVASIKPVEKDEFSTRPEIAAGRFKWTTQTAYLIGYAYNLDFSRVNGSSPVLAAVYAIEATFDSAAGDQEVRAMLQALLAERFQMRARRATREAEGYAIVVGSRGPKVAEAKLEGASSLAATLARGNIVTVTGKKASMAELAQTLERSVLMPVWDRTGLSGRYDFEFRYAREITAASTAPWIGTALEESLGLKFEKQRGPTEAVVVDSIEPPSEN